jgi:MYXO-CTERM domain-containing protein
MRLLAASAAATVGLLLLFSSRSAEACSPACAVAKLAPVAGATVPASAPGLLLIGSSSGDPPVTLVDGNGATVPGSFLTDAASQRRYFAPASALTPGSYATRGLKSCNGAETIDTTFTVTAAAALPTSTGALSVKKTGREMLSAWTSSGSCVEPVDAAYVDLDVNVDATLAPYLSVVTWQTKVDGKWWSQHDPVESNSAPEGNAHSYLRLFTPCDGKGTTARDQGLSAGKHDVEVRAFIPGGAALAPATLSINVTCDGSGGDIVGDGEITGGGSGATGEDRTGSEDDTPGRFGSDGESAPPSAQDGCSTTPQLASSSSTVALAVIALLALAGLRRRATPHD